MRIRRAGAADVEALHRILRDAGAAVHEPTEHDIRDLDALLRTENAGAFIASDATHDAGVAFFQRQGDVFWLFRIAVVRAKRGEGVGKALVAAVEAAARGAGASAVFAQVAKGSDGHAFLEALGYGLDNEEHDVVAGRSITLVDLVKLV